MSMCVSPRFECCPASSIRRGRVGASHTGDSARRSRGGRGFRQRAARTVLRGGNQAVAIIPSRQLTHTRRTDVAKEMQEGWDLDTDESLANPAVDARQEDVYWQAAYWRESYYCPDYEYDDYAPAYCVGYIGYAQYGGSYDDAEKSLCANWERIRGDSRLPLADARQAMRAAWLHAAGAGVIAPDEPWRAVVEAAYREEPRALELA
jgi:hypothetical protein